MLPQSPSTFRIYKYKNGILCVLKEKYFFKATVIFLVQIVLFQRRFLIFQKMVEYMKSPFLVENRLSQQVTNSLILLLIDAVSKEIIRNCSKNNQYPVLLLLRSLSKVTVRPWHDFLRYKECSCVLVHVTQIFKLKNSNWVLFWQHHF